MAAETFSSEKALQLAMEEAIEQDRLGDMIIDAAGLKVLSDESKQAYFPILSMDHLSRRSCIAKGALALSSLDLLHFLTGDKNISIASGESLRPDIICYNPERESLVLFELKKTGQTAREALTELLAYEHEIKNQLPFLGTCDVNFVLVSPEWTTLMDHAVASAVTWSGKRILCLEAGLADGKLTLKTRIPQAWKITGSAVFPESAVSAVTLSLYDDADADTDDADSADDADADAVDDELDHRLLTALSIMAREGDRSGSNGFAILWRDHWSGSMARHSITLCGVSPFAFYAACRQSGLIGDSDGALVDHLDRVVSEFAPSGHADGLLKLALSANTILGEICSPQLEGFTSWHQWLGSVRRRAEPLRCEFWGVLGDHARRVVLNPTMRSHGRPRGNGMPDWTDPFIGVPMLNEFFGKTIFKGGDVDCSSSFHLGRLLGTDWTLKHTIKANEIKRGSPLHCMLHWNCIDLFAAMDEVRLLANSAVNVESPSSSLKLSAADEPLDDEDFDAITEWLAEHFLQGDAVHRAMFHAGLQGGFLLGDNVLGEKHCEIGDDLALVMRFICRAILERCALGVSDNAFSDQVNDARMRLMTGLGVSEGGELDAAGRQEPASVESLTKCWAQILALADLIFEPVWHRHAAMASSQMDWPWLKQGVQEARQRGEEDVGVVVSADGTVGTGHVFPPEMKGFKMAPCDPETEVYFLDASNGFGVITIRKWSDLEGAESLSSVGITKSEKGK